MQRSAGATSKAVLQCKKALANESKKLHPSQFQPTIGRKTLGGWLNEFKTAQQMGNQKVRGSAA
jgi:hypothetical protein